jgi:hypothetical protein
MFGRFGQQEIKEVPENDKNHLQFAARQTCFLKKNNNAVPVFQMSSHVWPRRHRYLLHVAPQR